LTLVQADGGLFSNEPLLCAFGRLPIAAPFLPMADADKRINCVKVCFTDREYIDLGRLSAREDRKLADMARVMVCRGMYGIVRSEATRAEGTESDDESP
jgi:hypothetical protein